MALNSAKLWKIVQVAVGVVMLLNLAAYMYVWNLYFDTLPRSPDKLSGRIYADNFHGIVVYENRQEHFRLQALEDSFQAMVLIFLSGAAVQTWRAGRTKGRRQPLAPKR